jgi:hypothetical protein
VSAFLISENVRPVAREPQQEMIATRSGAADPQPVRNHLLAAAQPDRMTSRRYSSTRSCCARMHHAVTSRCIDELAIIPAGVPSEAGTP